MTHHHQSVIAITRMATTQAVLGECAVVTLFAPQGVALYAELATMFPVQLTELHHLLCGDLRREHPVEEWESDLFSLADESNPFPTEERMDIRLYWYRDQFGPSGVNCQLFLTAHADFPPLGWAMLTAHRQGIALVREA